MSHAILTHNRGRTSGLADGIVITPSHNPPEDGGFKYNPPHGGPAETAATRWIERDANRLLSEDPAGIIRIPYQRARSAATTHRYDYLGTYVDDLASVVDMDVIRNAGLKIGADPLGGASVAYWQPIQERHGVKVKVVNDAVDPRSASCQWIGTARFEWTARPRMPWRR